MHLTWIALLVSLAAGAVASALEPREIAVIAARGNRESMEVAKHYCDLRGVPRDQIILIDTPDTEVLDRDQWRWAVRPEIREWLAENDPEQQLRCLTPVWGVPLKITAGKATDRDRRYSEYVKAARDTRVARLEEVAAAMDRLAEGAKIGIQSPGLIADPRDENDAEPTVESMRRVLDAAIRAAQQRIAALPRSERREQDTALQRLATIAGGSQVLYESLRRKVESAEPDTPPPPKLLAQAALLRGRVATLGEVRSLFDSTPPSIARDAVVLDVVERAGGLLESAAWADELAQVASRGERTASFDSELSLLLWDDGYELLRWQPNYLNARYSSDPIRRAFRTFMVARLDGPDLATAKRLVDDAIAVEQQGGLRGKAYFDARGLAKRDAAAPQPGSYADYDRALLLASDALSALKRDDGESRFEVVLNEQPELFIPGQCPNAALYSGWYSLAKYVDAFDWNQGANAYHLASAEASTLKEIDSECWCRRLLMDGVAATIGPVNEPYLMAFPRPDRFFPLLTDGRVTLVEAYYLTKPFNSWQMTLIGDPLYRPFGSTTVR